METVETSEHRSFPRYHNRASAVCFRVDAQRHSDPLRHKKSRRESDRSRQFFLRDPAQQSLTSPPPQLLDVAEGLNFLHASYTIHGDLKGVRPLSPDRPLQDLADSRPAQHSHRWRRSRLSRRFWTCLNRSWEQFHRDPCKRIHRTVDRARDPPRGQQHHSGSRRFLIWHGRVGGRSLRSPGI